MCIDYLDTHLYRELFQVSCPFIYQVVRFSYLFVDILDTSPLLIVYVEIIVSYSVACFLS